MGTIGIPLSQVGHVFKARNITNPRVDLTGTVRISDTFGSQRKTLLKVLEDPSVFEAVLDESKKATPQVKILRQFLSEKKISSKELFSSPSLLANTYRHIALEAEKTLKKTTDPKKREELQLQIIMMKSLVKDVQHTNQPSELHNAVYPINSPQTNQLKFSGITNLFSKTVMLFTKKGDWRNTDKNERKKRCENIINKDSILAAGLAGALTKFMFADDAVLTAITAGTITRIAYGVYGVENVSPASLGVIVSKIASTRLADGMMDLAIEKGLNALTPILGEIATGASAYAVHQAMGRLFMKYFESQIAKGQTPGLPTSVKMLMAAINLGEATGEVDLFTDAQNDHYNTLQKTRTDYYDHHEAPTSYVSASGTLDEMHSVFNGHGSLKDIPGREDFMNRFFAAAGSADDFVSVGKTLANPRVPHKLAKDVIREFRKNGKLSGETLTALLNYGEDLTAAGLMVLAGPNHFDGRISSEGLTRTDYIKKVIDAHFRKANGIDIDPSVILAWGATAGVSATEIRNSITDRISKTSPAPKISTSSHKKASSSSNKYLVSNSSASGASTQVSPSERYKAQIENLKTERRRAEYRKDSKKVESLNRLIEKIEKDYRASLKKASSSKYIDTDSDDSLKLLTTSKKSRKKDSGSKYLEDSSSLDLDLNISDSDDLVKPSKGSKTSRKKASSSKYLDDSDSFGLGNDSDDSLKLLTTSKKSAKKATTSKYQDDSSSIDFNISDSEDDAKIFKPSKTSRKKTTSTSKYVEDSSSSLDLDSDDSWEIPKSSKNGRKKSSSKKHREDSAASRAARRAVQQLGATSLIW